MPEKDENEEIGDRVKIHVETKESEKSHIPVDEEEHEINKRQTGRYDSRRYEPYQPYAPQYGANSDNDYLRAEPDDKPHVHVTIETEKREGIPIPRARRDLATEYTKNIIVPERAENNMGVIHEQRVNEDIENTEKRNKILKIDKRALYGPMWQLESPLSPRATIRGNKADKNPILQLLRAAAGQKTQKILGLNSKAFDIFPGPLPDETNAALNNNLGKVSNEAPSSHMPASVDQQIMQKFKHPAARQQNFMARPAEMTRPQFIEPGPEPAIFQQEQNQQMIPSRGMIAPQRDEFDVPQQQQQEFNTPQPQDFAPQPQEYAPQPQEYSPQQQEFVSRQLQRNSEFLRQQPQFPTFPRFENEPHRFIHSPQFMPLTQELEQAAERKQIMQEAPPSIGGETMPMFPSQQQMFMQQEPISPMPRQMRGFYQRQHTREIGGQTRGIPQPYRNQAQTMYTPREESSFPNKNFVSQRGQNEMMQRIMERESNRGAEVAAIEELEKNRQHEEMQRLNEANQLLQQQQMQQGEQRQQQQETAQDIPIGPVGENQNVLRTQNAQSRHQLPFVSMLSNRLFSLPGENREAIASNEPTATPEVSEVPVMPSFIGTAARRRHAFPRFYQPIPHFDSGVYTHPVFALQQPVSYYRPLPLNRPMHVTPHIPKAVHDDDDDEFDEKPEVHVHIQTEKSNISKPSESMIKSVSTVVKDAKHETKKT